ncbi:type II secretion system F family protein [Glutamicibacter sp. NPDC127525]|uniref:type II secretion system F family protein n=1 Tax=unclassified Glutamicibacter TaxID=2627139 RepID=UPI003624FC8F
MQQMMLPIGVFLLTTSLGLAVSYLLLQPKKKLKTVAVPARFQWVNTKFSKAEKVRTAAAFGAAVILCFFTRWFPALILFPLAVLTIPALFSNRADRLVMERLEALEAWTRSLSGLIGVGTALETALKASLSSAAESIRPMVKRLIARLEGGWMLKDALESFADEIDDPTADIIIMNLMLAAEQRGAGLSTALENIAESVHDEIKARHQIDTDRSKTRSDIRIIIVGVAVMLAIMPFMPMVSEPYKTTTGQILYLVWVALLCYIVYGMYQLAKPYRAARLLGRTTK